MIPESIHHLCRKVAVAEKNLIICDFLKELLVESILPFDYKLHI